MFRRLTIISCCALAGYALGRWLSAPAVSHPPPLVTEQSAASPSSVPPAKIPPPARAGRATFAELYLSLRTYSPEEQASYLHSILALPAGPDRRAALTAFFQCLASINSHAAAALISQVTGNDDIQRSALAILAATPAPETPVLVDMLLGLSADIDPKWRAQKLRGQVSFWAAMDPSAAAQFADQHRSDYPELVTSEIIEYLAAADPAAAARWMAEHPDVTQDSDVVINYIHGLYQHDPAEARRYLLDHSGEKATQEALGSFARVTFFHSAEDSAEFVKSLPTKEARAAALAGISDINADLFANKETDRTNLYAGLAEWITKFPPGEWPNNMSSFLDRWRRLDPEGSIAWMAQLPSPARGAAAVELSRTISPGDLKQILATAPGEFSREIATTFLGSLQFDPAERKAIIESLGLSPEEAARLSIPPQ
ncbi:MAG: hypothetical protein ABI992_10115 [Chthoniobacterales bacterium]